MKQHKGWYSRGHLPHFDAPNIIQGITFRLWDSLPQHVAQALAEEKARGVNVHGRREEYLNNGYGACYLRDPRIATIVEQALFYYDGERYRLYAWVIMPNHVHVVIEQFYGFPLDKVVHSWKSYTATKANALLGRRGQFWFNDYFDRYIRDERHFANVLRYVHQNPVTAGLVEEAEQWEFSSAGWWSER